MPAEEPERPTAILDDIERPVMAVADPAVA
jgi:hypothetical protein